MEPESSSETLLSVYRNTQSQAPSIPQPGHITAVEMVKLYVKPNVACGRSSGHNRGYGSIFKQHINKNSGAQYLLKTKGAS